MAHQSPYPSSWPSPVRAGARSAGPPVPGVGAAMSVVVGLVALDVAWTALSYALGFGLSAHLLGRLALAAVFAAAIAILARPDRRGIAVLVGAAAGLGSVAAPLLWRAVGTADLGLLLSWLLDGFLPLLYAAAWSLARRRALVSLAGLLAGLVAHGVLRLGAAELAGLIEGVDPTVYVAVHTVLVLVPVLVAGVACWLLDRVAREGFAEATAR